MQRHFRSRRSTSQLEESRSWEDDLARHDVVDNKGVQRAICRRTNTVHPRRAHLRQRMGPMVMVMPTESTLSIDDGW